MAKYKLTSGKHHSRGQGGEIVHHKVGDIIELSEAGAKALADRVVPYVPEPPKAAVSAESKGAEPKGAEPKGAETKTDDKGAAAEPKGSEAKAGEGADKGKTGR